MPGLSSRKELIRNLEGALDARVLVLVTGDRQGMETRIAPDLLPLLSEHLSQIGMTERLALFIYTAGGDAIAGWGLVNLIRQYCKTFVAVIPFRALSCGTLIALGADEVQVGRHGLLSPVDPSVGSPFNPAAPGSHQPDTVELLPVSVEDMIGFLDLARQEIGLRSEESMVEVLKVLSTQVHPLALGAVYRAREQTALLARRLLSKHIQDEAKVQRIVDRLTKELPTHSYLMGRDEAVELELPMREVSDTLDVLLWDLYKEYQHWLQLTRPVSPVMELGDEDRKRVRYDRAVVESLHGEVLLQHTYVTDKDLSRVAIPGPAGPVETMSERTLYQGWVLGADGEASE